MVKIANFNPNPNFNPLEDEEVIVKAGKAMVDDDSFEQHAKGALQLAELNNATSSARTELLHKVNTQVAPQIVQSSGSKPLSTLSKEAVDLIQSYNIDTIKNNVHLIQDPEVKKQFELYLQSMGQDQALQAKSMVQGQQLEYAAKSFEAEHKSLIAAAAPNPHTSLEITMQEYSQRVVQGVSSGLFTQETGMQMIESFRSELARERFNHLLDQDPRGAKQLLQESPGSTLMNSAELKQAWDLAEAKERDLVRQEERVSIGRQVADNVQRTTVEADLKKSLEEGSAGEADILKVTNVLSGEQVNSLYKTLDSRSKSQREKDALHNEIMEKVQKGESLQSYNKYQIDQVYQHSLEFLKNMNGGEEVSLSTEAAVARSFRGGISSLSMKLTTAGVLDTPERAVEAFNAFNYIIADNKEFLYSMRNGNADQKLFAVMANHINEMVRNGVPDLEAVKRARNLYEKPDEVKKGWLAEMNKDRDLKGDRLQGTILDTFDADGFLGFGSAKLGDGVTDAFMLYYKESIAINGDKGAALDYAKKHLQEHYSVSEFNKSGKVLMWGAPEKVFQGVPEVYLRNYLFEDLAPVIPGLNVENVELHSDVFTRYDRSGRISYALRFTDYDGIVKDLVHPETGEFLRWSVNPDQIRGMYAAEDLDINRVGGQIATMSGGKGEGAVYIPPRTRRYIGANDGGTHIDQERRRREEAMKNNWRTHNMNEGGK